MQTSKRKQFFCKIILGKYLLRLTFFAVVLSLNLLRLADVAHAGASHLPPALLAAPASQHAVSQAWLALEGEDLVLDRSMLGVPLLLYRTATEAGDEPFMLANGNRCFLQIVGDTLYLMQPTTGRTHTSTHTTAGVLAVFPITARDATHVRFQFTDEGFSAAGLVSGSQTSAVDAATMLLGGRAAAASLRPLLITSLETAPAFASVEYVDGMSDVSRLTLWRADASTMPAHVDDPDDNFGYFNDEYLESGQLHSRFVADRLDPRVPHTFYISANTPSAYRDAIARGVLGWNAVFGREFLRVADAPASVRPGDPRFFLIQWMEVLDYGVGYWQSHPDTGEVLSAWIMLGAPRLDGYVADYLVAGWYPPANPQSAGMCRSERYAADDNNVAVLFGETVTSSAVDLHRLELMKQRILTGVVLHEVGHVLGLRHNFAGSLQSAIAPEEERATLQAALYGNDATRATLPLPGNSVMDYYLFADRLRMLRPGSYDRVAIAKLYDLPAPADVTSPQLFCTDEQSDIDNHKLLADCTRRDSGAEPLLGFAERLEWLYTRLSLYLEQIITAPLQNAPDLKNAARDPRVHYLVEQIRAAKSSLEFYQTGFVWNLGGEYGWQRQRIAAHLFDAFDLIPTDPSGDALLAWFSERAQWWRAPLDAHIALLVHDAASPDTAVAARARDLLERIRWQLTEPSPIAQ